MAAPAPSIEPWLICLVCLSPLTLLDWTGPLHIGVTYHTVDLDEQKVIVKGPVEYDDVLAKIKKTGKEVRPTNFYLFPRVQASMLS